MNGTLPTIHKSFFGLAHFFGQRDEGNGVERDLKSGQRFRIQ